MGDFGVFTASTADEGDLSDPNEPKFGFGTPNGQPIEGLPVVRETSNSRIKFRRQVLREIVTPPYRDQQQHEAVRTSLGAYNDQTDTQAETVFHRLGVILREMRHDYEQQDGGECLNHIGDLMDVYAAIEQSAISTEPITWCKACGEEIPLDCKCKVPSPRQDKAW